VEYFLGLAKLYVQILKEGSGERHDLIMPVSFVSGLKPGVLGVYLFVSVICLALLRDWFFRM